MEEIIKCNNLTKKYGETKVLDDISLRVLKGTCVCLVGESGSGKSTLAKIIMGLSDFDEGNIEIAGIKRIANHEKKHGEENIIMELTSIIDVLFQDSLNSCNPNMTIAELIFEVMPNKDEKKLDELLNMVHLNTNIKSNKAREVSGGQLKRVCMARTLALNPKIIIFDEAVSGLDPLIRNRVLDLLIEIQKKLEITYLFITHDLEAAYYIADELMVLKNGKIAYHFKDIDGNFSSYLEFRRKIENSI